MKKLFIVFFVISSVALLAQSQKIGYVDSQVLYQNYAPAIKAQQDLQTLQQNWARTKDSLAQAFQAEIQNYQNQKSLMTPQKQQETEQKLMMKQNAILQQEQLVLQKAQSMMKPITDAINDAIAKVAKEQKMTFILEKGSQAGMILHYADAKYDMTYKVLDKLKK
jgi:outer membrane protein